MPRRERNHLLKGMGVPRTVPGGPDQQRWGGSSYALAPRPRPSLESGCERGRHVSRREGVSVCECVHTCGWRVCTPMCVSCRQKGGCVDRRFPGSPACESARPWRGNHLPTPSRCRPSRSLQPWNSSEVRSCRGTSATCEALAVN